MGRIRRIVTSSLEMIELGKEIACSLKAGAVLSLSGDLGAGKTTFTQGLALGLGIEDPIQSPTFVYCNQYEGRLPLFHLDLYRMKGEKDFLGLGFEEYLDGQCVCVIEWPERIRSLLPPHALLLSFVYHPEGREVTIEENHATDAK